MTNLSLTNQTILNVYGEGLKTMRNGFNYDVKGKYHVQYFTQLYKRLKQRSIF